MSDQDLFPGSDKLVPAMPAPSQVLREVTPQITTVSAPFARFGQIKVGSRATMVKLQNDSIAVFSPSALTPAVRTATEKLGGNVAYLVAPDFEHHIFLSQWYKAFPNAKVIGVEGLPEKRAQDKEHREVPFSTVFTRAQREQKIDDAFDGEFDVEYVPGHSNKELVFNHRPSRTLIQADLIFNLPAHEQYSGTPEGAQSAGHGLLTRFFTSFANTHGAATGQKRVIWYMIAKDRKDYSASIRRIASWNFDRMIPCHGDVVETGAKQMFDKVMEWQLKSTAK